MFIDYVSCVKCFFEFDYVCDWWWDWICGLWRGRKNFVEYGGSRLFYVEFYLLGGFKLNV